MERNQFWIFVVIAVAFALAMQWIQHADPKASVTARAARLYNPDDFEPATTKTSTVYKRIRASSPPEGEVHIAGMDPVEGADGPTATATDGTNKQAPAMSAEEKKKEEEKKKKEEEKKKKKKKKKKKAEEKGDENKTPDENEGKDSADNDDDDSAGVANAPQPGGIIGGVVGGPDGIPRTLKEWEDYLLGEPDFKRTTLFIRYYQSRMIEAEIFYPIVDKMLDDDRTKMRELGVTALGATPSARSFSYLSNLFSTESGDTSVKRQVQIYLRTYVQLTYLPILANALRSDEINHTTTVEALRLLQMAANIHLKNLRPDQPSEQNQGTPRTPAASSVIRYFDAFTPVLTHMAQTAPNEDIRGYASQTLNNIQVLLAPHAG